MVPDPGCFPVTQRSRISPGKLFFEPFSLVSKNSSFTYSQVSLCLISFPSSFFVPLLSTSINFLPGDTSWQMCQLALFRWETSVILSNVSSVSIIPRALGSLSYLSMNFLSPPPIRLEKKKSRLPGANSLSSYLFQSHFFPQFPASFLSFYLKKHSYKISKLTRILHLISIYPFPSLFLFAAFILPFLPGPASNPHCQSTSLPVQFLERLD